MIMPRHSAPQGEHQGDRSMEPRRRTGGAVLRPAWGRHLTLAAILAGVLFPGGPAIAQEGQAAPEPSTDHGATAEAPDGERLYRRFCLSCHRSRGQSDGPTFQALQQMSSDQILTSMTAGKMMMQAEGLSTDEMFAITNYLTSGAEETVMPDSAFCRGRSVSVEGIGVGGWGVDLANTRHQPDSTITRANVSKLEVAWAFALPDVADVRSQPVVTEDTVFVSGISGGVYALDRKEGCIKWDFQTDSTLRTSMSIGKAGEQTALFVGDIGAQMFAINAHTGEPLWQRKVGLFEASTTTGTPVPYTLEGRDVVFVPISAFGVVFATNPKYECCKSHGAVRAFDAATGEEIWTTHMTKGAVKTYVSSAGVQQWGPSGAPVWTTPTIDPKRNRLYVGTGENTSSPATIHSDAIVALDMRTGAIAWSFQGTPNDAWNMACGRRAGPNCPEEDGPDFDFGAAAMLTTSSSGKEILVAGQKSGEVHALDPDTGKAIWQNRVSDGSALGGVHWGMTVAGDRVIVPIADPPFPREGYTPRPGVYALDLETGEQLWAHKAERGCEFDMAAARSAETPWSFCPFQYSFSAAPMSNAEVAFAASLDGRVFAFDLESGAVLWSDDTRRPFEAVNGIDAHGGTIDNAGVQLVGDMLLVNSGYSLFGQVPGNVIVAYRVAE